MRNAQAGAADPKRQHPPPQPALAKGGWLAEGETGGFRQQPTRESSHPSGGHPLSTLSLPFGQPAPSEEGAVTVAHHPQQCAVPKPEQLTLNGGTRLHSPPLPKGGGSPKVRRGDSATSQAGEQPPSRTPHKNRMVQSAPCGSIPNSLKHPPCARETGAKPGSLRDEIP